MHALVLCSPQTLLRMHASVLRSQTLLVRKAAGVTRRSLQHTDERGKLEGELVGGIDVVKCMAWEVGICQQAYVRCP